jgi:hypothetical protein
MNLHSNLQYPLLKYLSEEFTGSFYANELTFLNRLLILYHNRFIFSVNDDHLGFLEKLYEDLKRPVTFWTVPAYKRERINLMRQRFSYVLTDNPSLIQNLISRPDYSSFEAKKQTILQINQWLHTLTGKQNHPVDIAHWKRDLKTTLEHLLEHPYPSGKNKASKKLSPLPFYHILTGEDEQAKKTKFKRLIQILSEQQWISEVAEPGFYQFRKSGSGSRLWLGALYFCLNQQGHIAKELTAPQIAELFNKWLKHDISIESFVKIFQAEQQDSFLCSPGHTRYKYVQDCRLLIGDL